ncbi:hypothetical protein [Streptomyces sp. NPDC050535]|uniref:hypothetical protein n=1 Tax=Streptomyces sp. NPDC050535 TaxID=3365626 RepID=UPI0037B9D4E9
MTMTTPRFRKRSRDPGLSKRIRESAVYWRALPFPTDLGVINGRRSVETSVRLADRMGLTWFRPRRSDGSEALRCRYLLTTPVDEFLGTTTAYVIDRNIDALCAKALALPSSERWRTAVSTALLGPWCKLEHPGSAGQFASIAALRAETRALHTQLVPLWRRRIRHGRVLSLDADLGGLSLHDLVAADVDYLRHTAGGVFDDERLNALLLGLDPLERQVVFAYAEGEGTTWTEAAAAAGATDPTAFGERVRRKAKRLAAEQRRRIAQAPEATRRPLRVSPW